MVELTLILPVLLLMMLITVDFGRLFLSDVTLNNVVRVAANYGSVNPNAFTGTPSLGTYNDVVGAESTGLNCDLKADAGGHNPPIPTYPNGSGLSGRSVATMTCEFALLTPIIRDFFGGKLPISASQSFRCELGPSPILVARQRFPRPARLSRTSPSPVLPVEPSMALAT